MSNSSKRAAAATGGSGSSASCSDAVSAADTRPRGMVERYPEEVLLYWDNHVRHFIPEDKREEVYARAKRYCTFGDPFLLLFDPHVSKDVLEANMWSIL